MDEKDPKIEKNPEIPIQVEIKNLRKQKKMSQEELADALGISRQSIIALEQGKSLPSLPLAVSLCRFFNSAFEEVFQFEEEISQEIDRMIEQSPIKINIINSPHKIAEEKKEANMPLELEPWRPFREMVSLRDAMDRLFEESVVTPSKSASVAMPKIDIKEKKDSVVVKAEIPGVAKEDVEVEIADNIMTITGEKKEEKEEEKDGYYYKESHTGTFSRSFSLPSEVNAEKAEADVKNGILMVTVPKVEAKKAKKVTIKKVSKK